jgi:serine/threonine protein kinase
MDLAARNCLLAEGNIVKVADFGLTRQMPNGQKSMQILDKNIKLAIKWLAPECLLRRHFSYATDVWACGVTMWEILAMGETPFKDMKNEDVQKMIAKGEHLPAPRLCPPKLYAAAVEPCFRVKPDARPSFDKLVVGLEKLFVTPRTLSPVRLPPLNSTTVSLTFQWVGGSSCRFNAVAKSDKGPEPGVCREIGKLLNDPEVEKQLREDSRVAEELRRVKAKAAAAKRTELMHQSFSEQAHWYQPTMPKGTVKRSIVAAQKGYFLVYQDQVRPLCSSWLCIQCRVADPCDCIAFGRRIVRYLL